MIADVSCQDCHSTQSTSLNENPVWLEQRVVLFFRLWHMIFLCSGGVLTIVILLCCCFKCRIPRTKQEIESDFRRKKVTRKFRRELNKMQMDEIDIRDIRGVLDKVREKFHRKSSLPVVHVEEAPGTKTEDELLPLPKKTRFASLFTIKSKKPTKALTKTIPNGGTTDTEEIVSTEIAKL